MGMHLMPIILIVTGPPGTNYAVMKKAFEEGWGAVIAKTVSLDSSKVCIWPTLINGRST